MKHFELHLNGGRVIDMQDLHSMDNDQGLLTFKYTNTEMLSRGYPCVCYTELVIMDEDIAYLKDMDFIEEDKHE